MKLIIKIHDETIFTESINKQQLKGIQNLLKASKGNTSVHNKFPQYVSDMLSRHNAIATYYGGTNPGD